MHLVHFETNNVEEVELLDLTETKRLAHLSEAAIYRGVKAGTFPKQVKLGPKTSRWIKGEVVAWLDARIRNREGA